MKYNLFEIVGIYVVSKKVVEISKVVVNATKRAYYKAEFDYHMEQFLKAGKELDALTSEMKRRDQLVLDMYREGYSREEILEHFGEDYIGKDRVERVCDEEDRSWDAKA